MADKCARKASDLLIEHWQKGTTLSSLPEKLRPSESADGYAIQQHIVRLTDKPLFGWKIAATSTAGQQHINVARPLAGRILAERVTQLGELVPLGPNRMKVAELEFVFRMGETLYPRPVPYTAREVMGAVEGLFLGVEVPDSRYEDFTVVGAAQLIADNACADRFVLGPKVSEDWRTRNLPGHVVTGWKGDGNGGVVEGSGAAVLGDPQLALMWLANELSDHDLELRKGEYVTTGTCIVPIGVSPGDVVTGDYGDFGTIQVKFSA